MSKGPSFRQGTDNPLKLNYKLKDNPFIASDLVPAVGTIPSAAEAAAMTRERKSHPRTLLAPPTTAQSTDSAATEVKRYVRASVMRMAASNTVSSNPWKTRLDSMIGPTLPPPSTRHYPKQNSRKTDDLSVLGEDEKEHSDGDGGSNSHNDEEAEDGADHVKPEAETATPLLSPPPPQLPSPEVTPSGVDKNTLVHVAEQQVQVSLENEVPLLSMPHDTKVQQQQQQQQQLGGTATDSQVPHRTTVSNVRATTMESQEHQSFCISNHDIPDLTSLSSAVLAETEDDQGFLHIDSDNADSEDDDDDDDTAGLATPDDSSVSDDKDDDDDSIDDHDSRYRSAATEFTMVDSIHSALSETTMEGSLVADHTPSCLKTDEAPSPMPARTQTAEDPWHNVPLLLPPSSLSVTAIAQEGAGDTTLSDKVAMLQQLAVAQTATHLPACGFLDAQRWLDESAQARSSLIYWHERLKVETHAQRAIAAVLKLKAEQRDRALASDIQAHATAIDIMVDQLVSTLSLANNMVMATAACDTINTNGSDSRAKVGSCPVSETILARLRALAGVNEPMDLDDLVSRLEQQQRTQQQQQQSETECLSRSDTITLSSRLRETEAAFKAAQKEFTQREAALMLQSASVEAELASAVKEYERVTRNIADFNNERKRYDAAIAKLTRERDMLDKQLVDAKINWRIGADGQSMSLRKEFRQLMAAVKDEHMDAMQKEIDRRKAVEDALRNLRHELEAKRWDRVDTGVQTHFVYNSHTTSTNPLLNS
ncbi:hypothetical protein BX666DRAFT_2117880 [Dichotomocladium elegans]|nr:hypothetical protein BX666DRAFT_2117880 [Dichotomocladium elegans]